MRIEIYEEEELKPGVETVVQSRSSTDPFEVVFEDDGDTGYFYALDTSRGENPICDAMSIYDVKNVVDRDKPSKVQIAWSADGLKSMLLINGHPHAVFDFAARRGYCMRNFPPANPKWTKFGHEWSDDALELFNE